MTFKQRFRRQAADIGRREFEPGGIVLLGDCVMEQFDIARHLPDVTIYNNGICGDTTITLQESLYKRAIKYKPSKCFVSIGTNDLRDGSLSVKEIYQNIIDIVNELRRRSRRTEVYLFTTLPVNPANKDCIDRTIVDAIDNAEVSMLNYYLRNFARRHRLHLIDVNRQLKDDFDQLCLNYTTDGFHLNETGYEMITKLIRQHV